MRVTLTRSAHKSLLKVPDKEHRVITSKIYLLSLNPFPHGCKKLSHRPGWRIRVGDYRVVYTVEKVRETITIIDVGDRKDIYR